MVKYLDYLIKQFDKEDKCSCAVKSKVVKNGYIVFGSYESCKELIEHFHSGVSQDDEKWAMVDIKGNTIEVK